MIGVENLKKVLATMVAVGMKVEQVTEDGFQVLSDSLALLPNVVDLVLVIKNGKDAFLEFNDLDDVEREEVMDLIKEKFELDDDTVEGVVEDALDLIFSAGQFINGLKGLKKEE
jgi:hypothetical protein